MNQLEQAQPKEVLAARTIGMATQEGKPRPCVYCGEESLTRTPRGQAFHPSLSGAPVPSSRPCTKGTQWRLGNYPLRPSAPWQASRGSIAYGAPSCGRCGAGESS